MNIRLILHTIIISSLCTTFCWHLYFGKNGIKALKTLSCEVEVAKEKHLALQNDISNLEASIQHWQTDSFVKEKVAREDLLYSYTNEHVFMVPEAKT